MKGLLKLLSVCAVIMLTASTCDKENLKLYRDSQGNTVDIIGAWGLVEVQYNTAGVTERRQIEPETLMEFQEKGHGRSLSIAADGSRKETDTFRYEKYRGGITIFTEEEYKNNLNRSDEDPDYERGRTYYFKVIDQNTISSREQITSGTYIENIFSRF